MGNLESSLESAPKEGQTAVYAENGTSLTKGQLVAGLPGIIAGVDYVIKGVKKINDSYFIKLAIKDGEHALDPGEYEFDSGLFEYRD